ncbi:MAG: ABC transporter permease subunit [Candidatus Thermoplasmatota archaeon]|nr:ABC transporter permease subunit [Candidatus Thermoplasmatota archaeon]
MADIIEKISKNPVSVIAKKEIMDNVRNLWIIIMTIIFAILTIAMSAVGSYFSEGWQSLEITVALMMSIVQLLVPIIALMLGYAAIVGEVEKGSMSMMISLPVNRLQIVIGKLMGLGGVLSFTILVGFGIAGVVIGFMVSNVNVIEYLIFIIATILIGLVYLHVAFFFSTLFKKRSTALGGAIFLWFFFNMILPIILLGIAWGGAALSDIASGTVPDWYFLIDLINPMSVYSALVFLNVGGGLPSAGAAMPQLQYPGFYTSGLLVLILAVWIVGFGALSYWRFSKKDV